MTSSKLICSTFKVLEQAEQSGGEIATWSDALDLFRLSNLFSSDATTFERNYTAVICEQLRKVVTDE